MDDQKFILSVRCLTYNQKKYIVDTLNGFCGQKTEFPYVCIVIDDASTDGEPDVINSYLKEHFVEDISLYKENADYKRVFAKHKSNENCFFCVYFLKYNHYQIKKNKESYFDNVEKNTKYVAFCEGDDYWIDLNKLQNQVSFLEKNSDYSISHSNFVVYNEKTKCFSATKKIEKNNLEVHKNLVPTDILFRYRIRTLTVVLRKELMNKAIKDDPFLHDGYFLMGDTQLWYQLSKMGKVHYLENRTSVRRVVPNSASQSLNLRKYFRFELSSFEMRLYIAQKDNFSINLLNKFRKEYDKALLFYMSFDPEFTPLFPLDKNNVERKILFLEKVGLLKMYLIILACKKKAKILIKIFFAKRNCLEDVESLRNNI